MKRFVVGASLVYAGFLVFVSGFIVSTMSVSAFDQIAVTLLPIDVASPIRGIIIQLVGGLILVTGLLVCITSYPKPPPPMPPTVIILKVPEPPATATIARTEVSETKVSQCKFCSSPLREGDVFCPSCQRSQT